jgi:hypothetical protein
MEEGIQYDFHTIELDGIDVSLSTFREMFYNDGNSFQMNHRYMNDKRMNLKGQQINGKGFKLVKAITSFFTQDLGINLNCLDPCSVTEMTRQVTYYKNLSDFCDVRCSLSWLQLIETLYSNIVTSGDINTDLRKKHNMKLSVRFHNSNKDIRDVMLVFNYVVDFSSTDNETILIVNDILKMIKDYTGA